MAVLPGATPQSILSWCEQRGESVVRHALRGSSFSDIQKQHEQERSTVAPTWQDFQAVYARDAVYQDAFIITPPDMLAVRQSFVLIGYFWDIRVDSLGPARVKPQPLSSEHSPTTTTLRVPYTLAQRARFLQWAPWWHTHTYYIGYIDLQLQLDQISMHGPKMQGDWKIKEHDDRIEMQLPWRQNHTNLTDCLRYVPMFGIVFQGFRVIHGRAVQALAAKTHHR